MPTQKIITLYTFAELSEDAKEVARNWYRQGIDVDQWSDSVTEDAAQVGIKIEGFDIGRRWSIDLRIDDTEGAAHAIMEQHGKECETHRTAAAYLAERDRIISEAAHDEDGELVNEYAVDQLLDEAAEEFTRSIGEDYLSMLRNEYEYEHSAECIDELIECNGYTFTEDGERED